MGGKRNQFNSEKKIVAFGVLCTCVLCLIGLLLVAQLVMKQRVEGNGITVIVAIWIGVSVAVGQQIAANISKEKRELSCIVIAAVVTTVLFAGGLWLDGVFAGVGINLGAICVSTVFSCVICMEKKGRTGNRIKRNR